MSDILLSVGMQKGQVGASQLEIDVKDVVARISKNPPKVSVGLKVDQTALNHFKSQLTQILNSISLSKGSPLTINISGIGEVTTQTAVLKHNVDGVATAMKDTAEAANEMASAVVDANAAAASSAAKGEKAEKDRKATVAEVISAYKTLDAYIKKNPQIINTDEGKQLTAIRDNLYQIYQASLTSADGLATISKQDFKNLINQCSALRIGLKNAGKEGKTMGQMLYSAYEKFGGWMLVTRSLTSIIRGFKAMLNNVVSIDTAMTELKKVTNETDVTYNNFLDKASTRAKELGTTISDVVTATADFARLGYGIEDASSLADAAMIYKNVGDGIEDISQASESVISTMQAFGVEASDAMNIVDKFNEVGNNYAISSVGIGDALQRSAAAMAAANNSLDETIALITAANTIVQNPDSVGTTLKTVSMFLRAAKTEAEEAGESTEGMANSVSELRDELLALTGGKVDIQIDEDSFKSTFQILKELSQVWDELTDISQANILEMVGGKRNSNVVSALLENFEIAEKALETSANAAGSALAENEKYLESISGKLEKFQSSIEAFSTSVIDSSLVKLVVDFGTGLIDVLTTLQKIHVLLPLIAASAAAIAGAKNMSALAETMSKVTTISNSIVNSLKEQGSISKLTAMAVANLTNKEKALLISQIESAVASGTITSAQASQTLATLGLTSAEGALVVANKGLAASFKSLMASIPVWGWIALAVTVVIEAVTALTDAIAKNKQEMIDSANEIVDAYSSAQDTYQSNISSLESLRARFEQLSQGVDENGERVSLTAEEYEEYLSLVQQICNLSPNVVQGYDNEGRAIVNYTNLLNDAIASQKEYIDNERNIYLGKGKDIFDGKAEEYRQMQEELADAGEELGNAFNTMGFIETLLDPDRATAVHNAYHDVFEKLGIEFKTGVDTWTTSFDSLGQMYEKHDEIIAMLGETGAYTEEELNGISNAIYGLAGAYTSLNAIEGEQVDYLMEWVKDKDWYNSIPLGALDEMRNGLAGVNNPLLSFNENLAATEQYGKAFADAIQSDAVKGIMDMSNGLSDGSVSIESYNAAVAALKDSWDGNADVLPMIIAFLYSLTNGYSSSGDAAETAATKVKTFADAISGDVSTSIDNVQSSIKTLSGALSSLADGTIGVEDVIDLIQQFPELAGYVDLTADGFGNLDAGLRQLIKDSPSDVIKTLQQFKETNGLTGEAAAQVDSLCEALASLPTDAIRDASGEFGVLAESINNAKKAQNELEAALSEDDWDSGYEGRVSAFEGFQEVFDAGEYGSKAYAAYKEYFGLMEKTPEQVKAWMESNKKYFTENTDGVLSFLQTVEKLSGPGGALEGIASFDSETGAFWYDINQLSAFADELGWTEEMLQDFIYKYRMYVEEWTSRSAQDNLTEFSNAGLVFDVGDETFASLDKLMEYTGLSKESVLELVSAMNELREQQGLDPIQVIGSDQITITQATIDNLLTAGATAEDVKALLLELAGQDNVTIEAGIELDGQSVEQMIADATGDGTESVSIDITMSVNDEEVIATVTTTAEQMRAILGEDWETKISADSADAEERIGAVNTLLTGLPEDTLVTVSDSTVGVRSNLSSVKNYLQYISNNANKTITITYRQNGSPISMNASGTRHATRGPSLLGDEYSPDGSPKPELVVSKGRAYLAGQNGPEIGYLNEGDIVYNAAETKRILRGNTLHSSIQAHAGGTANGLIDNGGLSGGDYNFSGKPSGNNHSNSNNDDDEESWFERQYKDHQHWLAMDQESVDEYLKWLDEAYQKAYEEGIIDLDEYYKYQEEVYQGVQDQFKDHINDIDHEISLLEAGVGNSDEIINLSLAAMADIEAELAAARAAGLDENSDYIQWLEQQWMNYSENVTNLREQAETEAQSSIDNLVEYRIKMLKQEIQDQKDALSEQLSDLQDFYDKQRKMLQDQYDEEKYLEEQKEKRKSVTDIRSELAMLENDDSAWAQKRKLELQAELSDAEKELNSFEKDHALDMTLDMLDEQQAAQEAQIQAQMDALDEKLNDPHALFNQALADITNNTEALYKEFIEYNRKHGTGNDQDIADMWEEAYIADLEYQDTHDGEHPDGIEIGNYTGYARPENPTPPEPPEEQNPPEEKPPEEPKEPEPPKLTDAIKKKVAAAIWNGGYGWGNGSTRTNRLTEVFGAGNGIQDLVNKGVGKTGVSLTNEYTYANMRKKFKGYASGTENATPGWHELFEGDLDEYVFTSSDGNRYRMFSGLGDKVLNGEATDFLYDFANSGGTILTKMLADLFGHANLGNIAKPVQAIEIHSGDIIVQGNANERTVSEIRRAQRENLKFVITEFNKLNK